MAKFNKEAIALYSVAQADEATVGAPTVVDALAALDFSISENIQNQSLVYVGDETSRDEINYYSDWYEEATGTLIVPARPTGTLSAITDLYLTRYLNAAGVWVTLTGTAPNQVFTITNDPVTAAVNNKESLADEMLKSLSVKLKIDIKKDNIQYSDIHGWRYAYGTKSDVANCYWNKELRLGICGDWFSGGSAESAFINAKKLANLI